MNKGSGLIGIYHEDENCEGKKGEPYTKLEKGSIKVEGDNLRVTEPGMFHRLVLDYPLKGWTGRYGMPLEFLLSVHLATMAPDLSYKMAMDPNINTEVQVLLKEIKNLKISSAIRRTGETTHIQYSNLSGIQDEIILDKYFMTDEEALRIFEKANGILESYIGDDVPKWKCTGPGKYKDIVTDETWTEEEDYRNRS